MEFATFSLLRNSEVCEQELMRCLYPEDVSDVDLIRVTFDAAKKEEKEITVYHRRAINELMDRFASRQLNTSMWEAAEALRELEYTLAYGLGEGAKEVLNMFEDEIELKSVNSLMTIITTGGIHGDHEKAANAIRCLADHYVRERFQYDDEEYFSLLLYRTLRDEKNGKVLFEAASALELLDKIETLKKIQDALGNRDWSVFPEVRRKLVSIERKLCARFGENPLEVVHGFGGSRRRGSAPPSCENTLVAKRVNRA